MMASASAKKQKGKTKLRLKSPGVVSKFLKKFGQNFALDAFPDQASRLLQGADATQCGVQALGLRTYRQAVQLGLSQC